MSKSRQITDFPRSEAGLVDRYIGTAYQVVLGVYKNLDKIEDVHKAILSIPTIAEDAVNFYLEEALDKLEKFLKDHKDKVDAEYAILLKAIKDLQKEVAAELIVIRGYKDEAKSYRDESAVNATKADTRAKDSDASAKLAKTSETNASTYATNAKNSETKANTSATNAKTSEDNAKKSAQEAKDAVNDINNSNEIVLGIIEEAREIETKVKTSETNAKSSETKAKSSENAAASSASQAKSDATKTGQDRVYLDSLKTDVIKLHSETETFASNAKTSETNSKSSETKSKTSETNAKSSEDAAHSSAGAAGIAETNASAAASRASTSATNSKASEDKAKKWADNAVDTPVESGKYSAKHWANKSEKLYDLFNKGVLGLREKVLIDFKLPTRTSTNYISMPFKYQSIGSQSYFTMPIVPVIKSDKGIFIPNLFEPVQCTQGGFYKFKYVGDTILYGNIQGQVNFATRFNRNTLEENRAREFLIWLMAENAPIQSSSTNFKRYLLGGRDYLVNEDKSFVIDDSVSSLKSNNTTSPPTNGQINAYKVSTGSIYKGSDPGYFTSSSTSEELTLDPANPEVMTTKWMTVTSVSASKRLVYFYAEGESTVCGIQFKRTDGSIFTDNQGVLANTGCNRYIRIPYGVDELRVHYSAKGDSVVESSIKAVPVSNDVTFTKDIDWGAHTPYSIKFDADIIFYPNAIYSFNMNVDKFVGASTGYSDRVVRLLSGGIQFSGFKGVDDEFDLERG